MFSDRVKWVAHVHVIILKNVGTYYLWVLSYILLVDTWYKISIQIQCVAIIQHSD